MTTPVRPLVGPEKGGSYPSMLLSKHSLLFIYSHEYCCSNSTAVLAYLNGGLHVVKPGDGQVMRLVMQSLKV